MAAEMPGLDDPYVYNADLIRVLDGDTVRLKLWKIRVDMDFGFYIKEEIHSAKSTEMNFRLLGINTPETRGVAVEVKALGAASTAELARLLGLGVVMARTSKPDKYGRWLVDLWVTDAAGVVTHVNSKLVEGGFAVPYMV